MQSLKILGLRAQSVDPPIFGACDAIIIFGACDVVIGLIVYYICTGITDLDGKKPGCIRKLTFCIQNMYYAYRT